MRMPTWWGGPERHVLRHYDQAVPGPGLGAHPLPGAGGAVEEPLLAHEGIPPVPKLAVGLRQGERHRRRDIHHLYRFDPGHDGTLRRHRRAPRRDGPPDPPWPVPGLVGRPSAPNGSGDRYGANLET